MLFCPTHYARVKKGYLEELGRLVESRVHIMRTGPYVVSPTITLRDLEEVAPHSGASPSYEATTPSTTTSL